MLVTAICSKRGVIHLRGRPVVTMMAGIPALMAARLSEAPNNLYKSLQASINLITYYLRDRLLKFSSLTEAIGMEQVPSL